MVRGTLSRRGFATRALGGLVAAGLPTWFAREAVASVSTADRLDRRGGHNETLQLGLIGCGGRGLGDARSALKFKGVELVAVADVDDSHVERAAKELAPGKDIARYRDFRELLDRDDVDAVIIATPDHWHTIPAIYAARRGKDVYCEKPLTLTVEEGKSLVRAVRKFERVFQVGSQQRSDDRFRLACELVRNGRLGKISKVETWIGNNPRKGPFSTVPTPEGLDWDFWCGQTPLVDYVPERCHSDFRWWYEYSGGKMTDWGAHHNDIAQWALGMDQSGPIRVTSHASPPILRPNAFNTHVDFEVTYTYDKDAGPVCDGTELVCSSKENGVKFWGTDNHWIFVNRSKIEASDPSILEEPLGPDATRLTVSRNHMANFLDCVRDRQRPICDVEVGHRSVSVCHIGVISMRLEGKELAWDPQRQRFIGDALADGMLGRTMRAPWSLEA
ncbi:MAG: Gfo/Idh/MocA family oxidoreductase [Isosphaeraceae bacterium]